MLRKQRDGVSFFVTQVVYDAAAAKSMVSDYHYACVDRGQEPAPVIFTLAVCGSLKTLAFLEWLGVDVPRWMRNDLGPASLAAGRYVVSSALLALLLTRRPPEARRLAPHPWLLAGMALTGVALFAPSLYLGLRYTTTVNATLINGFGPLITGALAALLIREPMSRAQVAGAIAGLVGIAILISGGSAEVWQGAGINPGDLIILVAVSLWSLYSVLGRRVMRERSDQCCLAANIGRSVRINQVGTNRPGDLYPLAKLHRALKR